MYIKSVTDIRASPDVVWEVLADPSQWPRWTTSLVSV